jgi:PAS domain S-box-containing protein
VSVEQLLQAVSDGVYGLDAEGLTTFVNVAAQRMLGFSEAELLGQPQHDVIHHHHGDGDPYPRQECSIYEALRTGRSTSARGEHFWRRDGTSFPVQHTTTPIVRDGRLVGAVVTFRDITAELEQERSAQARMQALLDQTADAFFALDRQWRFIWLNRRAVQEFGRPEEELVGNVFPELFPEAVDTPFFRMYEKAMRTGRAQEMEFEAPEVGRWFAIRALPTDEGLSVFFRDVSEAHHARQRLEESEARYRTLAEAIPQQVWTALPDGDLDWVSPQVSRYFGRPPEAIVGQGWVDVIHPDDLPDVIARWSHSLSTGESYEVHFRLRRHDEAYRWHLGRAMALTDDDGAVMHWFGTNTDIHDQRMAEAARDEVLGVLSHDLRNPLGVVRHASELLLRQVDDERVRRPLRMVDRASRSMEELIDNLLDATRLEAGGISIQARPVELPDLLEQFDELMRPHAERAGVQLQLESADAVAQVDSARVLQALGNLVSNGLRYAGRDGTVTVKAQRAADAVLFEVRDTGPGFDEQHLPHLFERFWQERRGEGAGLGLAIVKGIAEAHGGTVAAHNDGGAVFTLRLPQGAEP